MGHIQQGKTYRFFGWETADITDERGMTPRDYYDLLTNIWTAETCAPRLRSDWTPENRTLGQCSITAFLVQDIFGGEVYGILRPGGNYHCYNVIDGKQYDLTIEQFGDEAASLVFDNSNPQSREVHFAKQEKYERYLLLKSLLKEVRGT